jgi:putative acetyltransferase
MPRRIEIRESRPGDLAKIALLYPKAFPDEDLLPLVRSLLQEVPTPLSLVGINSSQLAGHVIYTACSVVGSSHKAALLGPLAVAPAWQRQGIGSAIVRAGLRRLEDAGFSHVYVLGDPAYYGRFGFLPEYGVAPPYALPAEWDGAWQSKSLSDAAKPCPGNLSVPKPWLQRALWAP